MKATDLEIKVTAIALQKAGRLTESNLRAEIRGGSSQRIRRIMRDVRDGAHVAKSLDPAPEPATTSPIDLPAPSPEERANIDAFNLPSATPTLSVASAPEYFAGHHCQIARAVLRLTLPEAARAAKVSRATLARFEGGQKVLQRTRDALFDFFSSRGVILRKTSIAWKLSSSPNVNSKV